MPRDDAEERSTGAGAWDDPKVCAELTRLLRSTGGPETAPAANAHGPDAARLLELVYGQLRQLAQARMRTERAGHTLQPTALVHEAYARLVNAEIDWRDRYHFFAAAAEAMRRILVEHARARSRIKRGGPGTSGGGGTGEQRRAIPLNIIELAAADDGEAILSVDEAFRRLQEMDADLARTVQLRFFAGLSEEETALAMGVSDRTVRRDWTLARAWLRRWLDEQRLQG